MIAAVAAAWAEGVKVTVTIDNPSHAGEVAFDGKTYEFNAAGKIEFVAEKADYLYFSTKAPYAFGEGCSCTYLTAGAGRKPQTDAIWGLEYKSSGNNWIGGSDYYIYYEINLTTVNLEELRSKTLTVNVEGNAGKIVFQSNANSEHFALREGNNTVKFMAVDCPFQFWSSDYIKPLYEVWQNGEKQPDINGFWSITAEDGDVLDIKADFPDKDVTINVTYEGDASPESLSKFTIDNVDVADMSKPVVAKMGQALYFAINDTYYTTDYFIVDGEAKEYNSYSATLYNDVNIEVKQTRKPAWNAQVTVDVPGRIEYNEHYSRPVIVPQTTAFTVGLPVEIADGNYISFRPSDSRYAILSVTLDGKEVERNIYVGDYQVYLAKDGQKIEITTTEIVRDKLFAFYFDSPEKTDDESLDLHGWYMTSGTNIRDFSFIEAGYNLIDFDYIDNAFNFFVSGPIEAAVKPNVHAYLNNEPNYIVDNSSWRNNFEHGDVFKVYIGPAAPSQSTVEFTVKGEDAVEAATVDLITELEVVDGLKMENILPGTRFALVLSPGYSVTINGEKLEGEQNVYTFTVNDNTQVVVSKDTGIEAVAADSKNTAVFNLLGVKVSDRATNGLPAGLYIQNGKKLLVK